MRGSKLLDKWLTKNVANVAEWCRKNGLGPSYVCHLRKGRRVPALLTALAIERATKKEIPVQAWAA